MRASVQRISIFHASLTLTLTLTLSLSLSLSLSMLPLVSSSTVELHPSKEVISMVAPAISALSSTLAPSAVTAETKSPSSASPVTSAPSIKPTATLTLQPSAAATTSTTSPSMPPSAFPSSSSSSAPTSVPISSSSSPTLKLTAAPVSSSNTAAPSAAGTTNPTAAPVSSPSTSAPSAAGTTNPTAAPFSSSSTPSSSTGSTTSPIVRPSFTPTASPASGESMAPTTLPTSTNTVAPPSSNSTTSTHFAGRSSPWYETKVAWIAIGAGGGALVLFILLLSAIVRMKKSPNAVAYRNNSNRNSIPRPLAEEKFASATEIGSALTASAPTVSSAGRTTVVQQTFAFTRQRDGSSDTTSDITVLVECGVSAGNKKMYKRQGEVPSTVVENVELIVDYGTSLGRGSQARVYLGEIPTQACVAVKVIDTSGLSAIEDDDAIRQMVREFSILKDISHDSIVRCYTCAMCVNPAQAFLVLEYCDYGDIWKYIKRLRKANHPFSAARKLEIIADIASAIAFLHCLPKPVLHGDLKSSNVLIAADGRAKVADFGISAIMQSTQTLATLSLQKRAEGTPAYMAPEMFSENFTRSRSQDVYAFGVVIWEIYHEQIPWADVHVHTVPYKVREGVRPHIQAFVPTPLAEIIEKCWNKEPRKRPLAKDLLVEISSLSLLCSSGHTMEEEAVSTLSSKVMAELFEQAVENQFSNPDKALAHGAEKIHAVLLQTPHDPLFNMHETSAEVFMQHHEAKEATAPVDSDQSKRLAAHLYSMCSAILLPEMKRMTSAVNRVTHHVDRVSKDVDKVSGMVSEVLKYSQQQLRMLEGLVFGHGEHPLAVALIAPPEPSGLARMHPRHLYARDVEMRFICPISGELGNPYTIRVGQRWLRAASPVLKVSAVIAGAAVLKFTGANLRISVVPETLDRLNRLRDTLELLERLIRYEEEEQLNENEKEMDAKTKSIAARKQFGDSQHISAESRAAIRELLATVDSVPPVRSGLVRAVSSADGSVCWIHPEADAVFQRYGYLSLELWRPKPGGLQSKKSFDDVVG